MFGCGYYDFDYYDYCGYYDYSDYCDYDDYFVVLQRLKTHCSRPSRNGVYPNMVN